MIIKDVSLFISFWGGFSSFFTIWQLCLMQITPFFFAFAIGLYLLEGNRLHLLSPRWSKGEGSALVSLLLACAGYILGFSVVFALMGTSGWRASSYILYNIEDFRTGAAAYITAIALLMLLHNIYWRNRSIKLISLPVGLLLGASFALAYSPCIPPVMSDIMNFGGRPGNAHKGFHLLVVYGFGVTLAFSIPGSLLAILADYFVKGRSGRNIVVYISSGALFSMAFLLITDLMIRYKSFLVGLVLD